MTLTTSPDETGELLLGGPTQQLNPPPLRRPEANQSRAVDVLPRTIEIVSPFGQPDTMPVPDPLPIPSGPEPKGKTLVPCDRPFRLSTGDIYRLRRSVPYADQRAARGLPPLTAPKGYVGRHRIKKADR